MSLETFNSLIYIFIISLLLNSAFSLTEPKCRMSGVDNSSHSLVYDGKPLPLEGKGKEMFISLCHNLLPSDFKENDTINACCNEDQLEEFNNQIQKANIIFPDCKICLENIMRLTCNLICHPHQADFTQIIVSDKNPTIVSEVKIAISTEFSTGLFDSCKDIKLQNSGLPILSFLCSHAIDECDEKSLIESLFKKGVFPIIPEFFNSTQEIPAPYIYAMNEPTLRCHMSYQFISGNVSACSCQDCENSCPPIPNIPEDKKELIFNIFSVYQISIISCFFLFVILYILAIVAIIILKKRRKYNNGATLVNPEETSPNNYNSGDSEDKTLIFPPRLVERFPQKMQRLTQSIFQNWGTFVATHRIFFILFPLAIVITLSFGIVYNFQITSDPIDIWSSPNTEFRKQKTFFETNFGPFYRTEQIIIKSTGLSGYTYSYQDFNVKFGPVVNTTIIEEIFYIQKEIESLSVDYNEIVNGTEIISKIGLKDICYKPLSPFNDNCAFFSLTQYFQNSYENFKKILEDESDWHIHLANCVNSPGNTADSYFNELSCISTFMAPIQPDLVFGGYIKHPLESTSLVLTYVVNNYLEKDKNTPAILWEKKFLNFLKNYSHPNVILSYSAERSIEDEIERQSHGEILTVGLSYLIMFLYVAFSLGRFPRKNFYNLFIEQKVMLGFIGVIMVLISVIASIGFFSYLGFKVTMIVLEVLPFLTLAVGVDNIFLIVHEYHRMQNEGKLSERTSHMVGQIMSTVGQGMAISAVAQVATFSVGAVSNIPAVRGFSLFAAGALALNFFMQMTCFLAVFAFDTDREKARRPNIFCCIKLSSETEYENRLGLLERFFKTISHITLNRMVKPLIIFLFITGWFASIYVVPSLDIGLDQTIALPSDSYLQKYFQDIFKYLRVGPPVYLMVSPGFPYEQKEYQKKICSGHNCNNDSLTSLIFYQSRVSNYSKISIAADSWVDTYLGWIKPDRNNSCCSYKNITINGTETKSFCPSIETHSPGECTKCIDTNVTDFELSSSQFIEFLPWFLNDIPNQKCALGGKPSYGNSVILNQDYYLKQDNSFGPVFTSRFMTYHTALSTSNDFINAMAQIKSLTKNISAAINHNVSAYSVFYIFYESYFTIWKDTSVSFAIAFATVLGVNLLLYGFDLKMSILITFLIFIMDIVNGGFMYLLHINLNPVSLVNLIMFIGINVEFLSHIGRAFMSSPAETRVEKAREALIYTGSSVFSGIAMTKLLGVIVLSFSSSLLFKIYYFQMYAVAILVGTLHGLILLPVILSYIGPLHTTVYTREINSPFNDEREVANV